MDEAPNKLEYVPLKQLTQVLASDAPIRDDHVPATHSTHDDAPEADDHVPAEQLIQLSDVEDPDTLDQVPGGHERQLAAPLTEDHEPGAHSRHDIDPGGA